MSADRFIQDVILKIGDKFSSEDLKFLRDVLYGVSLNYSVEPVCTELSTEVYQLPDCYKLYLASKGMDGRLLPSSTNMYKMVLEDMLYYFALPVTAITVNHLRAYFIHLQKRNGKPLAKATMNQRKSIVRSFFQWLAEEEYIDKDPSARIKPEKVSNRPEPTFTDLEVEKIRDACKFLRDRAIVDLFLSSGIRIAELCNIKVSDIDFDKQEVIILGKGDKYRIAYFNGRALYSIQEYMTKERKGDSEYLFVTFRAPHRQVSEECVRSMLSKVSSNTGVSHIHPHRFRHTMATDALNKGADIYTIQKLLGHSRVDTTTRYAHLEDRGVKSTYKKLF